MDIQVLLTVSVAGSLNINLEKALISGTVTDSDGLMALDERYIPSFFLVGEIPKVSFGTVLASCAFRVMRNYVAQNPNFRKVTDFTVLEDIASHNELKGYMQMTFSCIVS